MTQSTERQCACGRTLASSPRNAERTCASCGKTFIGYKANAKPAGPSSGTASPAAPSSPAGTVNASPAGSPWRKCENVLVSSAGRSCYAPPAA